MEIRGNSHRHHSPWRSRQAAEPGDEPVTAAEVVELLLLVLLGLPLMVGIARAAVWMSGSLLGRGLPPAALVGSCVGAALLGAALFALLATITSRFAQRWSRKRRAA